MKIHALIEKVAREVFAQLLPPGPPPPEAPAVAEKKTSADFFAELENADWFLNGESRSVPELAEQFGTANMAMYNRMKTLKIKGLVEELDGLRYRKVRTMSNLHRIKLSDRPGDLNGYYPAEWRTYRDE